MSFPQISLCMPTSSCPPSGGVGPIGQRPCFTSQQGCRLRTPFPSCVRLRNQQVGNLPRKAWEAPQRYGQDSVKAHSRESQCSVHDIQDTLDLDPAG